MGTSGRNADDQDPEQQLEVVCHLDVLLQAKDMTLVDLSERVGVSVVNLSVLKNNRAKAIRFTTLVAICAALDCNVGDLLSVGLSVGTGPEGESK